MTAEEFRFLKHELRTPINHIVGYSELLMEEAQDAGEPGMAACAKEILANGRILARLLERELLACSDPSNPSPLEALRIVMTSVIQSVAASCAGGKYSEDSWQADLGRISAAAHRLSSLLDAAAETPYLKPENKTDGSSHHDRTITPA